MNHHTRSTRARINARSGRGGFTLLELLVVVAIIVLVIAALVPAFGRLIESQNYASAVNTVTATLGNARARAVRDRVRTGVVFLWDAVTERCTLQVVEVGSENAGALTSLPSRPVPAYAEVLVPARASAPVQLPAGIGVYGLSSLLPTGSQATVTMIEDPPTWWWYAGERITNGNSDPSDDIIPWLFPRNDGRVLTPRPSGDTTSAVGADPWRVLARDPGGPGDPSIAGVSESEAIRAVRNVTTFFVLFSEEGIVLGTRRSGGVDFYDAFLDYPDQPVDVLSPGSLPYDDPQRFDPEFFGRGSSAVPSVRRSPNPEVMLRVVDQLAIVDMRRMEEGVGIRRPWLGRSESTPLDLTPDYQRSFYRSNKLVREVGRWIDLNAEIINFNRFTGNVIRRTAS